MTRPALQNKRVGVRITAFRARNVFGTFEKRAPGLENTAQTSDNKWHVADYESR